MLSPDEILYRVKNDGISPGLNLAMMIAASALMDKKTWEGNDYATHWGWVAFHDESLDEDQKIIAVLHDVVEDNKAFTTAFLQEIGYSGRVISGVEALTKQENEKYLDFIERCSCNLDAIKVKLLDIEHNSQLQRAARPASLKQSVIYPFAMSYLKKVALGVITPGENIWAVMARDDFKAFENSVNVIGKYTNRRSITVPRPPSLVM